jgi:hypothetical protein
MNTHTLELDLSKDGLGAGLVRVGQGDKHGTTIKALIYDGGAEATLTGFTAYLEVLLPDKRHYYRAVAAISGNAATVTVDENKLCSVAGYTDEAYFAFEKDGVRYSTERFAVEILRCVTEGQQPAQNWDDAIDNLISRGNEAVSAANTAAGAANTAADAANKAAARVETAVSSASSAATAANNAAAAANSAASAARTATTSANNAASAANDAAGAANTAAQRANNAADRVDSAIADAEKATKSANEAASKADASANKADIAAADAITAAEDARDATKRALSIIGSGGGGSGTGSGGGASSEELEKVKADNAVLARALAEATDSYIVIDEICYVPSSRAATITEELLSINDAAFDSDIETITLV